MPAGPEITNPRRGLRPWEQTLLRHPCRSGRDSVAGTAAVVTTAILQQSLSRRVMVRPATPSPAATPKLAWHARIRNPINDTEFMIGVDPDLGRVLADAMSTSISSIRGHGALGSVERGILDFIALNCLDAFDRLDLGGPFELVHFGSDAEFDGDPPIWFSVTTGGRSGLLALPLGGHPELEGTSIETPSTIEDTLVLTCGIPFEGPSELLDALAPGDLVLAGLPRDGAIEIRSTSGWIAGSARVIAATREQLEIELESVGVRPTTGPWIGLGERRFPPGGRAPVEVGVRMALDMMSRRGNATVNLPNGRRLFGEAVTVDGRNAVRVLARDDST